MASNYSKQDWVWLLRLKAAKLRKAGQMAAAREFQQLAYEIIEHKFSFVIKQAERDFGLTREIPPWERETTVL